MTRECTSKYRQHSHAFICESWPNPIQLLMRQYSRISHCSIHCSCRGVWASGDLLKLRGHLSPGLRVTPTASKSLVLVRVAPGRGSESACIAGNPTPSWALSTLSPHHHTILHTLSSAQPSPHLPTTPCTGLPPLAGAHGKALVFLLVLQQWRCWTMVCDYFTAARSGRMHIPPA